jgi:hypothetical protein
MVYACFFVTRVWISLEFAHTVSSWISGNLRCARKVVDFGVSSRLGYAEVGELAGVQVEDETRTREELLEEIKRLRRQLDGERAGVQRCIVDDRLHDQALLAETAKTLIDFPRDRNLYQFIGEQLQQLEGVRFVIVSSFESDPEQSRVRAIAGVTRGLDQVLRILGKHPIGLTLPLAEASRAALITGSLIKISAPVMAGCESWGGIACFCGGIGRKFSGLASRRSMLWMSTKAPRFVWMRARSPWI